MDIGGSNCRFVATDLLGRVLHRSRVRIPARMPTRKLANWVSERLVALLENKSFGRVTVGLPGIVDPSTGCVRNAPNLRQLEGLAFTEAVRAQLPCRVTFDNDSNMAVLGEIRLGAARGHRNVVMFTIGTGLGAGVVLDGHLLRGRSGLVGELGYIPFGPDGSTLEALLSAHGLLEQAAHRGIRLSSPSAVFDRSPQRGLQAIRRRFSQALLATLVVVTVVYEPDVVVLGGGVANSLLDAIEGFEKDLRTLVPEGPRLVVSAIGDLAGAFGAVVASLHGVYTDLGVDAMLLDGRAVGPELTNLLLDPPGAPSRAD
ncbi:MAG: ROK family protein [Actinomycetota bacterium]|nr:ROK family protein [Actinomycetota bacterium]